MKKYLRLFVLEYIIHYKYKYRNIFWVNNNKFISII
jgi:hypothetical protein